MLWQPGSLWFMIYRKLAEEIVESQPATPQIGEYDS